MSQSRRWLPRVGALAFILAVSAGVAACGQTGPLYLPKAHKANTAVAAPATAPAAHTSTAPAARSR